MNFNTEFLRKPVVKKHAVTAYRGLSAAAILWMFATFATTKDLERTRQWQQSQQATISAMSKELAVLHAIVDPNHYWRSYTTDSIKTNTP